MGARDDYPQLARAWGTEVARALDEIDRLRDAVGGTVCPYVRTSDEGTVYCSLGTA